MALLKFQSISKKALMAITGLLLSGFIFAHIGGNLTIYLGPDALNAYGAKLRNLGPLLWVARGGLLVLFVTHLFLAISLTLENRKARPVPYHCHEMKETSIAARTMMLSGLVLLCFLLYHLSHFTLHWTHPSFSHLYDSEGRHDVYKMVILGFQSPLIAAAYVASMAALCIHLSHGLASLPQSLGLNRAEWVPCLEKMAKGVSLLIFIAYSSIPISVLMGWLQVSGGAS